MRKKLPEGQRKHQIFSIRLDPESGAQLERIAKQANKSKGEVIRQLIDHAANQPVLNG